MESQGPGGRVREEREASRVPQRRASGQNWTQGIGMALPSMGVQPWQGREQEGLLSIRGEVVVVVVQGGMKGAGLTAAAPEAWG